MTNDIYFFGNKIVYVQQIGPKVIATRVQTKVIIIDERFVLIVKWAINEIARQANTYKQCKIMWW